MSIPLMFSLLFFILFGIYAVFGIYTIINNHRASLNRSFFAVCMAMGIWAFGFSVAISAPDLSICFFWRRVSAVGWGSLYSILMHFFLILTGRKSILSKRWIYPLIYLPALVCVYVFSISTDLALAHYQFVHTNLGWTNISKDYNWDWFFNIYYGSFMLAGMGLIWQWGRKSKILNHKRQASLILLATIAAFVMGTLSDLTLNTYFSINIPQIGPLITLIPITACFIAMKKYGLMNIVSPTKDETVLNDATRARVYLYITFALIIGGFLNFISQYFIYGISLRNVISFSTFLIMAGLLIHIIQRSRLADDYKDYIILFIITLLVPIVTIRFIKFASITIWAFPFIFIIIFIVYNQRRMMVYMAVSILATQILVWMLAPSVVVRVEASDHVIRIGLFALALWAAFYVNDVYLSRLKENANQIGLQKLIGEITADFVSVNYANLDERIRKLLKQSGQFFQIDRACVFLFDSGLGTMTMTHEWCDDDIEPVSNPFRNLPAEKFSWWMGQILDHNFIHISDVEELPASAAQEKQQFIKEGVQSLISIPMVGQDVLKGFLIFYSVKSKKRWSEDHINHLRITSNVIADALSKCDADEKISHMAYFDHLTGLPNRALFMDRVDQAIKLAQRTGKMVGILFLDLDSFKTINDSMGHKEGDELLETIAAELVASIRNSDTVARFGGDEFLIMINNISKMEDMVKVADNIIGLFSQPFQIKDQEFYITASAGVAVFPVDGENSEDLIRNADIAMYNAKDKGKNQYVLCSPNLKDESQKMLALSNGLHRALERNELELFYQPQISLSANAITGLEALLRWKHSEYGMVPPNIFIPLAEKSGLINSIGEWVLKTACGQNKSWQDKGLPHVRMAVNLSAIQLRNPRLVSQIASIISETGLKPQYLELEITESAAVKQSGFIVNILTELKKLGITISIDDFGTEYSSLSRLKTLPVDRIKMDMQFVHGIEKSEKDRAITKVIINLAKSLGLQVIAEGVETYTQLEFLNKKMCDEVQGYYYFKPMPAHEVEVLLADHQVLPAGSCQ
ncbi:MAG: EAL domain-containing protein [Syntrophomonadaceae bacterium]